MCVLFFFFFLSLHKCFSSAVPLHLHLPIPLHSEWSLSLHLNFDVLPLSPSPWVSLHLSLNLSLTRHPSSSLSSNWTDQSRPPMRHGFCLCIYRLAPPFSDQTARLDDRLFTDAHTHPSTHTHTPIHPHTHTHMGCSNYRLALDVCECHEQPQTIPNAVDREWEQMTMSEGSWPSTGLCLSWTEVADHSWLLGATIDFRKTTVEHWRVLLLKSSKSYVSMRLSVSLLAPALYTAIISLHGCQTVLARLLCVLCVNWNCVLF